MGKKTVMKIESFDVVMALKKAKSPSQRATATRLLNRYVSQRGKAGFNERQVRAGIKARLTVLAGKR